VNHLEAASVALDSKLVWNPGQISSHAPLWNGSILAYKRQCALALLAICYRYLGEESSYNKALEKAKARTIRKDSRLPRKLLWLGMIPILLMTIVTAAPKITG
jgi:hypothetical protein